MGNISTHWCLECLRDRVKQLEKLYKHKKAPSCKTCKIQEESTKARKVKHVWNRTKQKHFMEMLLDFFPQK